MKKIILCFLMLVIIIFSTDVIFASNKELNQKAVEILNKHLEIKSFQVDVGLEIGIFSERKSRFNFIYYYQAPDKVQLETKDFVLLPREAIKTLQPNFFHPDKYDFKYLGKKEKLDLFELKPLDEQEGFRLILWLDLEDLAIRQANIFFQVEDYEEEFAVDINYQQIKGYSMPVYVEGRLAVPTKFGMGGEIKDRKEGSFTLKLYNYQLDIVFPGA